MKKLLFSLIASFTILTSCFAQDGKTPTSSIGSGADVVCSDFNISVSIVVASISTTIYVCCGVPFQQGPNVPPCAVVSKKTYDLYTGQNRAFTNTGVLVADLFSDGKVDSRSATYVDVTSSSARTVNGKTAKIKKGRYQVDRNGYVFFEIEYL